MSAPSYEEFLKRRQPAAPTYEDYVAKKQAPGPVANPNDPGVVKQALAAGFEAVKGLPPSFTAPFQNVGAGAAAGAAAFDNTLANLFMVADGAAHYLSEKTGLSHGGAFLRAEQYLRKDAAALQQQSAAMNPGHGTTARIYQMAGQLPFALAEGAAAVAAAGPVVGFGLLGALGSADRGAKVAAIEAAKGIALGSIFKTTETGIGRLSRGVTVGTGAAALEATTTRDPQAIGLSAAATGLLAALTARPPQKMGRFAPEPIPEEKPRLKKTGVLAESAEVERFGSKIDVTKPQGAYTTPVTGKPSAHEDLGTRFTAFRNPKAKVLEVDHSEMIPSPRRGGLLTGQSAGIAALRKFIGDEKTFSLLNMKKPQLAEKLASEHPEISWTRFHDTTEMLEGYAGVLARSRGYDAILAKERGVSGVNFDEYIALTSNALQSRSPTAGEPTRTIPAGEGPHPSIMVTPRVAQAADQFLGKDYSDIAPPDRVINLNLRRIEGPNDLKAATADLVELLRPQIDQARRGVITHQQTAKLADDLGMTVDQLLTARGGKGFESPEQAVAARVMNRSAIQQWYDLGLKIKSGKATEIEQADFLRSTAQTAAIIENVLGKTAEAGRTLSSFNIRVGPSTAQMKHLREVLHDYRTPSGRVPVEKLADMVASLETPEALAKFAQGVNQAGTSSKLLEFWISANLLSGPQTHVVNSVSNFYSALLPVPETAGAAVLGKFRTGTDKVYFREVPALLHGFVEGSKEGAKLAWKVLKTEQAASPTDLFAPETKMENVHPGAIKGTFGKVVRVPVRMLMAGDAFFQSVAFRQKLRQQAMHQAITEGKRGHAVGARVEELLQSPTEAMVDTAYQFARVQTFTAELGAAGKKIQGLANYNPLTKVIVPFTRTPLNLFKYAMRRSPLAVGVGEFRADLAKGGAAADNAMSQFLLGNGLMAWIAVQAAQDKATGSGPADKELRKIWLRDHQPFSIKIGNDWVSLARLEPLSTQLGLAADFGYLAAHMNEQEQQEMVAGMALSFRRNIQNKTFLQGLSGAIEAMDDPYRYGNRFVQQLAGSLIPAAVAQANRIQDPVLRDTRTAMDRIQSRVPGWSADLPPINDLWGEPIMLSPGVGPSAVAWANPFYHKTIRHDKATEEALRLRANLTQPDPGDKVAGVELTPQEYSRLTAETGKVAKQMIDQLVSSPLYEKIPDGVKRSLMEDLYGDARGAARTAAEIRILAGDPVRVIEKTREEMQREIFNRVPPK